MNKRSIRISDDNGQTRTGWARLDGPRLNPEDWESLSIVHGVTGNPRGRPPKNGKPKVRTEVDGPFLYGYTSSTRADWAREREEREAALLRVLARKRPR